MAADVDEAVVNAAAGGVGGFADGVEDEAGGDGGAEDLGRGLLKRVGHVGVFDDVDVLVPLR